MSVNVVSKTGVNNGRRDIPAPSTPITPPNDSVPTWTRPVDWPALPVITESDQKFAGLVAITNDSSNYLAFSCTTSAGTYTVTWGDGTSNTYSSGATAQHQYNYNTYSGTVLSSGYKAAIVTVTATTANLTGINLQVKYVIGGTYPTLPNFVNKWLDIRMGGEFLSSVTIGNTNPTIQLGWLEQVDIIRLGSGAGGFNFAFCTRLQSIPTFNTSGVTTSQNFQNLFYNCYSLVSVPNSIDWSRHTNMFQMFTGCYNLQVMPTNFNISSSYMTGVTRYAFSGCSRLRSIPNFDCSKSTSAQYMFNNCSSLTSIPNLNFSTFLTDTSNMFNGCSSLRIAPFINTINVTTTTNMFANCISLTEVPLYNLQNAVTVNSMFSSCTSLTTVPPFNLAKATTLGSMFANCYALQYSPAFKNTNLVTNTSSMFENCRSLKTIELFDTGNVTNLSSMFSTCVSLVSVPQFNTQNALDTVSLFLTNSSLKTVPLLNTIKVTNATNMFNGCISLQSVPTFNTSNLTNMSSMFSGCSSLIEAPPIDTIKVTNMSSTFLSCVSLRTIPTYNTANLTSLNSTFQSCFSLSTIPLLNTANVTDMTSTFNNMPSLVSVPQLVTTKVINSGTTYQGTNNLVNIPVMNYANVTSISSTFLNANSVASIGLYNVKITHSLVSTSISKNSLESYIATGLFGPVTAQTLTITNIPAADTAIVKSCNFTSTNNLITIPNSTSLVVGQYVTGTGLSSTYSVSFNASISVRNFILTGTAAGLDQCQPELNSPIIFTSITGITGISTYTPYYISGRSSDGSATFTLMTAVEGGTIIECTGSGTATYIPSYTLTQIVSGTQARILPAPITSGTAVSLSFRLLNIAMATAKGWTVTG